MNASRYVLIVSLFSIGLFALVGAFNYVINPYLVFPDHRMDGLNTYKSDINKFVRQAKAYHPLDRSFKTLLVGNSRVEMGLDPAHSCLDAPAYNLGLPGAGFELQVAYALNLARQDKALKTIFMGLDFTDFTHPANAPPEGELTFSGQNRLRFLIDGEKNEGYTWSKMRDFYQSSLSLDATVSSVKTILTQSKTSPNRSLEGFNPANDFRQATRVEGPYQIFQHNLNLLRSKLGQDSEYVIPKQHSTPALIALHTLLAYTQENDIQLYLFINPLHDSFWAVFDELDMMDDYQRWHQDIIRSFQEAGATRAQLYDFGHLPGYTDEAFPEKKQKQPLNWFWEPAHYRKELGNLLINTMRASSCGQETVLDVQRY